VVRKLLKSGVRPDDYKHPPNCETALLVAAKLLSKNVNTDIASKRAASCMTLLIQGGASINISETEYGMTPLIWAARKGGRAAVAVAIKHGADVNARDVKGDTALSWAARNDRRQCIPDLLSSGADRSNRNIQGITPLMYACENGWAKTVEMLLAAGAEVDAVDEDGSTALMVLSRSAASGAENKTSSTMAECLLAHGANANLANLKSGKTALIFAAERNLCRLVDVLLKNGANASATDNAGNTARSVAVGQSAFMLIAHNIDRGDNILQAKWRRGICHFSCHLS
jgi:ankyrin repeat protein